MQENMICLKISILFSHFTPRDATLVVFARANVRTNYETNRRKIPMRTSCGLKWEKKKYMLKWSIRLPLFLKREVWFKKAVPK